MVNQRRIHMETNSLGTRWNDQTKMRVLAVASLMLVVIVCTQAYLLAKRSGLPTASRASAEEIVQKPLATMPTLTVPDPASTEDFGGMPAHIMNLQKAMDQFFAEQIKHQNDFNVGQGASTLSVPNIDLREEADRYVLRMDVPGADQPSMTVTVEGRTLTIAGKRESAYEDKSGQLVHQERYSGTFERRIQLPGSVKNSEMEAKYDKGVLTVVLPKDTTQSASKTIEVK